MKALLINRCSGCVFLIVLLFSSHLFSQQAAGLYYDNYAGVHGVIRNPAAGPHGYLGWDINLASVNAYAQTNYAYISNTGLFGLAGALDSLDILSDNEQVVNPNAVGVLFYPESSTKHAIAQVDIMGPSAWVNLHPVSVGSFTRFRLESNTPNIPAALGYYQYGELANNTALTIPKMQSAGAAWSEYGINLSSNALWYDETFSLGINLKYLRIHEAYQIYTPQDITIQKTDADEIQFIESTAIIGYTAGVGVNQLNRQHRGNGWAIDIGLSKTWERGRIGASLLDIGKARVKNETALHNIVVNDILTLQEADIENQNNLSELINLVNQSSADSTLAADQFGFATPAKLMLQLDYQLTPKIWVSGTVINNLAMSEKAIHAENNLTIAPRYESRWLSVATPVSISGADQLRIGLGARLGFITIGSDDLLSWFKQDEFNGSSIYAAVKINPWGTGKSGKKVNCPRIKRSPFDSANPVKGAKRMKSPR